MRDALIARLLPLGDKVAVRDLVGDEVVVDGFGPCRGITLQRAGMGGSTAFGWGGCVCVCR